MLSPETVSWAGVRTFVYIVCTGAVTVVQWCRAADGPQSELVTASRHHHHQTVSTGGQRWSALNTFTCGRHENQPGETCLLDGKYKMLRRYESCGTVSIISLWFPLCPGKSMNCSRCIVEWEQATEPGHSGHWDTGGRPAVLCRDWRSHQLLPVISHPLPSLPLHYRFQQLCRRVDAFLIDWLPSYCGRTTGCSLINVVLVVN